MKPLTGQDAFFIYAETPEQHQHTLGVLILDPSTAPEPLTFERVTAKMRRDIGVIPEFRQRLSTVPVSISPPALVDDPNFKLENHLIHKTLPKPGNREQLCRMLDDLSSQPLPKDRPLWEVWYIDGLEDGCVALANKSHHCIADGVQGAEYMATQFDLEPNPPTDGKVAELEAWEPTSPAPLDVVSGAWRSQLKDRKGFSEMAGKTYRAIVNRRNVMKDRQQAKDAVPPLFPQAPSLYFNGEITPQRSIAIGSLPLATLKKIKDHFGVKLNDVVLACCALALRKHLLQMDDIPDEQLVISVPVSLKLRGEGDGDKGNANGNMMIKVPVDTDDPGQLLQRVHGNTLEAKHLFEESFEDLMNGYISMLPPMMSNFMMKTIFGKTVSRYLPTPSNLTISNIPGPPIDLYMLGARLKAMFPIGPVISTQGLNVTLMSSRTDLNFSVHSCPDVFDSVWPLAEDIESAANGLLALVEDAESRGESAVKALKPKKAASKKAVAKKTPAKKAAAKKTVAKKKAAVKKAPAKKAPAKKVAAKKAPAKKASAKKAATKKPVARKAPAKKAAVKK